VSTDTVTSLGDAGQNVDGTVRRLGTDCDGVGQGSPLKVEGACSTLYARFSTRVTIFPADAFIALQTRISRSTVGDFWFSSNRLTY
jgi:hypothetical protein